MTFDTALSHAASDRQSGRPWRVCRHTHDDTQPDLAISMVGDGCITMTYCGGE
jgi:hypothetical protein